MEGTVKWPNEQCRADAEFIESQLPDLRRIKGVCEPERLPYWDLPEWQIKMGRVAEAVMRVAKSLDFPAEVPLKPSSAYETLEVFWRLICRYAASYTERDAYVGPWPSPQCRSDALFVEFELNSHLPELRQKLAATWGEDYKRRAEWRANFGVVMSAVARLAKAIRCPFPDSLEEAFLSAEFEALTSVWKHVRAYAPQL
jgi:hypothetical protein